MNIASKLPPPLNTFVIDVPQNTYYDFELPPGSSYPLSGVTYPVDYGNIPGYTGEDGHKLDLFVGSELHGEMGYLFVDRGNNVPKEHKFFVALKPDELKQVLQQLEPVLAKTDSYDTIDDLLKAIEDYKDKE